MLQILWLRHPEKRASLRGERFTGRVRAFHCAETDIPHTLIDLHTWYLRSHCVTCLLSSESESQMFSKLEALWELSFWADNLFSPAQVCGVPHKEVQEYGQTFGGSPAGLQPRSMPRNPPGCLWQKHFYCCGLRLVLLSLATGTFAHALIANCLHERHFVLHVRSSWQSSNLELFSHMWHSCVLKIDWLTQTRVYWL